MRLSIVKAITSLLALGPLSRVSAHPACENVLEPRSVQNSAEFIPRAAKGIVVPLQRSGNTWQGSLPYRVIFGGALSDQEMKDAASATYNAIKDQIPWDLTVALVSVMFVPGYGFAAGTIWKGSNEYFETMAQTEAPAFWAAVPGVDQEVLLGVDVTSKWHAEAVAAVQAEQQFKAGIGAGRWPRGTKIYTYGKINNIVAGKPACREGSTSVRIACAQWLDTLNIKTVD